MHLGRAAQATSHWFPLPPVIQIGNSVRNFSVKINCDKYFRFDTKCSPQTPAGWKLAGLFRVAISPLVFCWAFFLLVAVGITSSRAQITGQLRTETITLMDSTAGALTIYRISFEVDNDLPKNGKIILQFPVGIDFDISKVSVAGPGIGNNLLDGGLTVELDPDNRIVAIERDNTGSVLFGDTTGKLNLALVGNPTQATTSVPYLISITTQTEGGSPIDQGEAPVTIKVGALDHFVITPTISNQAAGPIPTFTITGKDAFNNNVAFNDSVSLSDDTGTLTPKKVKMNGVSIIINNAQITKAQDAIVIVATANGKNGASNSFNVTPGNLSKFALSAVPSPLVAGAPFTLTITAQDVFGNTVPSFPGPAYFKPNGEVFPLQTTINFANGVRNETIAYLKSATVNKQITVSQNPNNSGATGISNSFIVSPGKPSGTITFAVNPKAIPANRTTTTQVTSSGPIQDAQGNNVGSGKLFTVSVNDTAFGTITTADADPGTPGKQITTDATSRLSLTFKAGGKGGAAVIFVASVDGTASGSVNISVTQLRILAIETTPITVSQGQRNIQIKMRVQNSGTDTVRVESANLSFNGNVSDYFVRPPSTLPEIPGNGTIYTLPFSVNVKPNAQTGSVTINGQISGKLSSGISINDVNADTTDAWTVQTPAKISVSLQASQSTVTRNQAQPWKVTMTIKNEGEAAAIVNLTDGSTRTSLASDGHQVSSPSDPVIVPGKSFQALDFIVTPTSGTVSGLRRIDGQVSARELNSDSLHFADTGVNGSASITVHTAASVSVDSTLLLDVRNSTVSVGQRFQVKVKIKKNGQEPVDTVLVKLTKTGNSTIVQNIIAVPDPAQPAIFDIIAGSGLLDTFNASIDSARSANTRAYTVDKSNPNIDEVSVTLQTPAMLSIDTVRTSERRVRFGRTQPWYITVPIRKTGQAALVIDSSRVLVKIGGVIQKDYVVEDSTKNLNITFASNGKDSLIYKVTKTGTTGGTARLFITVYGHDKNSNAPLLTNHPNTTFVVESTALVTIAKTSFPASMNRVPGTEIASVDTGQVFPINVIVRNTGFEKVDTTWVSLQSTTNKSKIAKTQVKIGPIDTESGVAVATFSVKADTAANGLGEIFAAKIDSVKTIGGAQASIGRPLEAKDTTAVARIERPAKLELNLSTNVPNNMLTTGQTFTLRAVVKNLGQAQTDNSGKLTLLPNANFNLISPPPAEQSFVVGDTVKWQIQAPQEPSPADTLLVKISQLPRSKNSGKPAQVVDEIDTLIVDTFSSLLQIAATSVMDPLGAQDGVISTEQFFTIRSQISASNDLTNKTVTLTLPEGYSFGAGQDSTKAIPDSGTVYWNVQAPTDAEPNSVNLQVTARARDGQAQQQQSQDMLPITTKRRAILNLTPGISEPAGARNGVLSVGQAFTLSAILANTGEANLSDTVTVELNLGDTGISVSPSLIRRTVVFKSNSQVQTITWPAVAPNQRTDPSDLIFRITRLPLDENTNKAALPVTNPVTFNLTTVARGSIAVGSLRIVSPPGAMDNVLSTDQDFVVSDSIFWTNATQIVAKLSLPANFSTDNETQSLVNVPDSGSAKLSWRVRAPGQSIENVELQLDVTAMDAHNNTTALTPASDNLSVSVQQRADPRLRAFISNPSAATDGVVSVGQPFEVTAVIENKGQALLSGDATVSMALPRLAGYRMVNGQDTVQTSESGRFTWLVQARSTISTQTDFIVFRLEQTPLDVNTNQLAASTQREFQLAVRTEAKTLLAEKVGRTGGPTFRGQTNLTLLRVKLTNPGGPGSSNLVLQRLRVTLLDRDNKVVPANQALKAIRVVDDANRLTLYGELTPIVTTAESLVVNFATKVVILQPGVPDTIAILGDIADNTGAQNFRVAFATSQDLEVVDQDSGSVVVVQDQNGNSGSKFNLDADLAVLFDSDPQKSFHNYPNPLKPGNNHAQGEGTHFTYNLPEASAGELKIFTLLGELVWETSFSATDPAGAKGGHKLNLFWNGYNGAGKKVLNGVYIALLKTPKFGTFMTKVAVVK